MQTAPSRRQQRRTRAIPPLNNGDHLAGTEFMRRYEPYAKHEKYELIGGVVYRASPTCWSHGVTDLDLCTGLSSYELETAGVEVGRNSTTIMGDRTVPQPDLAMRILPEYGGVSIVNAKGYLVGPPELVAEISHSTVTLDMYEKKFEYERAGVKEYLVLCLEEEELHWFGLQEDYKIEPDARGIYRSRLFGGLWIDAKALLAGNAKQFLKVIDKGLASKEHAAFVKRLAAERTRRRS